MKHTHSLLVSALICLNTITSANAQSPLINGHTMTTSNTVFNWSERHFFNYFPNYESVLPLNYKTLTHESGWIYRYYPSTHNYIGVLGDDVYVAGASFSPSPTRVFSVQDGLNSANAIVTSVNNVPFTGSVLPSRTLHHSAINLNVTNGGYGSALAGHPNNASQFYALTDRGPTAPFKGSAGKGKVFPFPHFAPHIGLFQLHLNGQVTWLSDVVLKNPQGFPITGLPNPEGLGGTGRVPYDVHGNVLSTDIFGLDSEGLVALKDGTFWVSDEYGPHIVHFDATGREIGRINPFKHDARAYIHLPAELASRERNHGMEGLAITPDQKTLVGIMQSTLRNPNKDVTDSKLTRIVTIHLETGKIGQYLYKQDEKNKSNCDITALSATRFIVAERNAKLLHGSGDKKPSDDSQKLIYKIDLTTGTNLEEVARVDDFAQHETLGLTIDGQSLEEYVDEESWGDLKDLGIRPVQKELVVDLVDTMGYSHDKMEGLWVIDAHTIGVINDDDFATSYDKKTGWGKKYINAQKTRVDQNTLYIIKNLNLN